jgi:RNA polymerase sigma-70 factor (ECF subfamily)
MYHCEAAAIDGTAACAVLAPLPSVRCAMPDATLIARIATGDRLAMHALFQRHKTRVYRFILRLVGDAATADDLTSDVFLTVWRAAHKFQGRAAVSTWLLAIARFKALEEFRRRRDTSLDPEEVDAIDPAADPEASWAEKHRGTMLRKCLGALSPRASHDHRPRLLPRQVGARGRGDRRASVRHGENQDVLRAQEARRAPRRAGRDGRGGVAVPKRFAENKHMSKLKNQYRSTAR